MSALDNLRDTFRRDQVFDFMRQGTRAVAPGQLDSSAGKNILYLEDITVSFDGFKALNDLTLYIKTGELRCIIGPNGAGKSTMMDVITGKTRPDSGTCFFGQTLDLTAMSETDIAMAGIGRKFQKPTVFPEHTAFENLELAMNGPRGPWHSLFTRLSGEQKSWIEDTLATVGLLEGSRAAFPWSEAMAGNRHGADAETATAAGGRTHRRHDPPGSGTYRRITEKSGGKTLGGHRRTRHGIHPLHRQHRHRATPGQRAGRRHHGAGAE